MGKGFSLPPFEVRPAVSKTVVRCAKISGGGGARAVLDSGEDKAMLKPGATLVFKRGDEAAIGASNDDGASTAAADAPDGTGDELDAENDSPKSRAYMVT